MSKKRSKATRPTGKPAAAAAERTSQRSAPVTAIALALITFACLTPFLGKAFNVDEPLFLWTAKHIQAHPLDPYGFDVNWYGTPKPMAWVTKNPPLACYYIALVARLFGWGEVPIHLAFLISAIAVVLGTYFLARQFCARPELAALAALLTPVFMVSSTTVMCDTMMLAFWVWVVFLWTRGIERDNHVSLGASGLLVGLCALTKYYGICLIPLLIAYSLLRKRRIGLWLTHFAIPVVILLGYQYATAALYGRNLLLDAFSYASAAREVGGHNLLSKGVVGLAFTGGCLITAMFCAPLLWSRRGLAAGAALVALAVVAISALGAVGVAAVRDESGVRWLMVLQLSVLSVVGAGLLVLAVEDYLKRRDAGSALLCLWVLGTFAFAALANWSVNGRSLLPMVPAAAILLTRRMERAGSRAMAWPLIPAAFVAFSVAWADYSWANAVRLSAMRLREEYAILPGTLYFQGHWGLQYYLEAAGAQALDVKGSSLQPGDIVVIPVNNTNVYSLPKDAVQPLDVVEVSYARGLTTMDLSSGAGFYTDARGPLPFALGPAGPEMDVVLVVLREIRFPLDE